MGKLLIFSGLALVVLGAAFSLGLGKLPGDIVVKRENFTFFFPVVSMILISVILTIVLNLLIRK